MFKYMHRKSKKKIILRLAIFTGYIMIKLFSGRERGREQKRKKKKEEGRKKEKRKVSKISSSGKTFMAVHLA